MDVKEIDRGMIGIWVMILIRMYWNSFKKVIERLIVFRHGRRKCLFYDMFWRLYQKNVNELKEGLTYMVIIYIFIYIYIYIYMYMYIYIYIYFYIHLKNDVLVSKTLLTSLILGERVRISLILGAVQIGTWSWKRTTKSVWLRAAAPLSSNSTLISLDTVWLRAAAPRLLTAPSSWLLVNPNSNGIGTNN